MRLKKIVKRHTGQQKYCLLCGLCQDPSVISKSRIFSLSNIFGHSVYLVKEKLRGRLTLERKVFLHKDF